MPRSSRERTPRSCYRKTTKTIFNATGSALFDEIVKKLELYGSQTVPVALIGNALVSLKENLGSQLRNHGNMIAVTLRQVQKSEQVNVITVAAVQMTFAVPL